MTFPVPAAMAGETRPAPCFKTSDDAAEARASPAGVGRCEMLAFVTLLPILAGHGG
jgi:hypothetical protein